MKTDRLSILQWAAATAIGAPNKYSLQQLQSLLYLDIDLSGKAITGTSNSTPKWILLEVPGGTDSTKFM
jgi:hypothetical protein